MGVDVPEPPGRTRHMAPLTAGTPAWRCDEREGNTEHSLCDAA